MRMRIFLSNHSIYSKHCTPAAPLRTPQELLEVRVFQGSSYESRTGGLTSRTR